MTHKKQVDSSKKNWFKICSNLDVLSRNPVPVELVQKDPNERVADARDIYFAEVGRAFMSGGIILLPWLQLVTNSNMEENKIERKVDDVIKEREEFELRASHEAVEYVQSINLEDWDSILLTETLDTIVKNENYGMFKISINPGKWKDRDCYVIHVSKKTIVEEIPNVINIIAHVDETFTTLEQSIHEYLQVPENIIDKKTLMVLEDGKYIVQRTVTQENYERKTHETYSAKQMEGFICEGCHVVFQRILLKKGIPDGLTFLTFDNEANLSKMTFKMLKEREVSIADQIVSPVGIESTIVSPLQPELTWESFFLPDGRLVLSNQVGSDIVIRLSHLPPPPTPEKPPVITPLKWEEDMQLFSQFTDRKEELIDEHNTYIRRHPELHAILADFLQFVLLRKPDDVLNFAKDFFIGMSLSPITQT